MLIKGSQGEGASVSPGSRRFVSGSASLDATSVIIKRAILKRPYLAPTKGTCTTYVGLWLLGQSFGVWLGAIQIATCAVGYWVSVNRALEPLAFWGFVAVIGFAVVCTIKQQRLSEVEEGSQGLAVKDSLTS